MTAGPTRVVIAEDDDFTRSLVAEALRSGGFDVREARLPDEAWDLIGDDTHALVTDLDFGHGISSGPLLRRMADERPWVALVVLTSHLSPELAVSDADRMPSDLVYIVKSRLRRAGDIADAVRDALSGRASSPRIDDGDRTLTVTSAQADMLRMIASGLTTKVIAERRGTTVRAAETMVARLYSALGVDQDESTSPRIEATRLWLQGRIRVK
ncbi:DNA-binding response regulator [Pseudolysinimonas sp.]|jgi:DNA-binding NarL/FixJ family response regulator|uniref:DNA-binding response regulator n=1 Tax=Pseudolysinimonas sp. TaxID=2680009 RepID=UPI00378526B5